MTLAKPQALPDFLLHQYQDWKANGYGPKADLHRDLVDNGQKPPVMMISCCDSRVNVTSIFGADPGDMFVHRNIASLVPAFDPKSENSGTPAAIQYAVMVLKVKHLVVMGHSQCGGVRGCLDMCKGNAPALEAPDSFVGKWIEILRPAFPQVENETDVETQATAFEKASVCLSLENLMSYPFVADAVAAGDLTLHGLWTDIKGGGLEQLDAETGGFAPV